MWGYDRDHSDPAVANWYPDLLCELNVTLGTLTGATGARVTGTHLRADTLALVEGTANQDVFLFSPEANLVARAVILTQGCEKIRFDFKLTTAAPMNCLWKPL